MAQATLGPTTGILHHSDRGTQYCCHAYRDALHAAEMLASMTDGAHCYQNAVAERVWKSSARGFPRAWQHHFVLTVSR